MAVLRLGICAIDITSSAGSRTSRRDGKQHALRILRFLSALLLASVIATGPLLAQQKLSANDAKDHIGETATVCGSVVSTRYAAGTKGQPTFLNLDKPYPNQTFTVLI